MNTGRTIATALAVTLCAVLALAGFGAGTTGALIALLLSAVVAGGGYALRTR